MKQRQERADKGQSRKPAGQKRKHNWQVLLTDDENVIIENYLQKEKIDKAFFMRRAMLRAVPKNYRTLDLREPPEIPADTTITVASPIIAPEKAQKLPVDAPKTENDAPTPPKPENASKRPKSLLPAFKYMSPKQHKEAERETAKMLGIDDFEPQDTVSAAQGKTKKITT